MQKDFLHLFSLLSPWQRSVKREGQLFHRVVKSSSIVAASTRRMKNKRMISRLIGLILKLNAVETRGRLKKESHHVQHGNWQQKVIHFVFDRKTAAVGSATASLKTPINEKLVS